MLVLFVTMASPAVLAALLLAALCHELGHYLVLHRLGATIEAVSVTPFGVTMQVAQRPQLSYGREMLAVAAGPAVNLLLAFAFGTAGDRWGWAYLAAGAHLLLGVFNLLPVRPLDGGTLLWLAVAWCTDPFLADRAVRLIGGLTVLGLGLCGAWLWWWEGSPFLLLGAVGLIPCDWKGKRACKREKKQLK